LSSAPWSIHLLITCCTLSGRYGPPWGIRSPKGGAAETFFDRRLPEEFNGTTAGPLNPPCFRCGTVSTYRPLVPPWQLVQPYLARIGFTFAWKETVVPRGGTTTEPCGSLPRSWHPPTRRTAARNIGTGNHNLILENIAATSIENETDSPLPTILLRASDKPPVTGLQEWAPVRVCQTWNGRQAQER
jgi:hypothetical protein